MSNNHTPGPWWRDDDGFIASGSDETYITVASPNCSEDIDIDEREANARLIAAAPSLLYALEQLHAHHRAFSSSEDWTTLDDEARELAKSAINLATKK